MSNLGLYNAKLMAHNVKYSIKHNISRSSHAMFDGLDVILAFFNAIFGVETLETLSKLYFRNFVKVQNFDKGGRVDLIHGDTQNSQHLQKTQ